MKEILCEFRRGGRVESVHRVSLAVFGAKCERGRVDVPVFLRSCAKPIQCLTVVESGAADAYGFSAEEIAVISGSHPGESEHVRAVTSILKKAKLPASALQCGVHPPSGSRALRELSRSGKEPSVVHNNCSGKHAGMVAAAKFMGAPVATYLKPSHPLQKRNLENLARFSGVAPKKILLATDGCSAPTFALPLRDAARAMARFADAPGTPGRVRAAMMAHPAMVGRPCATLMAAAPGRVIAKAGAEGVYVLGFPGQGAGLALKVEDGNSRAWLHVIQAVVRKLGLLKLEVADAVLRNHAGLVVGDVRVAL